MPSSPQPRADRALAATSATASAALPGALCAITVSRYRTMTGDAAGRCRCARIWFRRVRLPLQTRAEMLAVLARRGMVRPDPPDRLVRAGLALAALGPDPGRLVHRQRDHARRPARADRRRRSRSPTARSTRARTRSRAALAAAGLGAGDRLAILCRNGAGFVETMVACVEARRRLAAAEHLDVSAPELGAVLEREQPAVLVHDGEFADWSTRPARRRSRASSPRPAAATRLADARRAARAATPRRSTRRAEEGRTVILTSGTTGAPKGARVARAENLEPLAWFLKRRAAQRRLGVPGPRAAVPRARLRPDDDRRRRSGCTVVLPRRFDAERDARADRAPSRRRCWRSCRRCCKRIMDLDPAERAPLRHELAARRAVQRLGARRPAGARVHGRVRAGALQPLRLDRGRLGDDRDAARPARGAGHGRPAAAPHAARDPRRATAARCRRARPATSSSATRCCSRATRTPSQSRAWSTGMMTAGDLGHVDERRAGCSSTRARTT